MWVFRVQIKAGNGHSSVSGVQKRQNIARVFSVHISTSYSDFGKCSPKGSV